MTLQSVKEFCLAEIEKYDGKLGKNFLRQLMLSMEKVVKTRTLPDNKDLNEEALLLGVLFHDVGRVLSDGEDHGELSFSLFEKNFAKDYDSETIEIVKDCCIRHGSKDSPLTPEGKIVQILDKAIVFEPEVMFCFIFQEMEKGKSFEEAHEYFLTKLEKWHGKIPDEKTRTDLEDTLTYMKRIRP